MGSFVRPNKAPIIKIGMRLAPEKFKDTCDDLIVGVTTVMVPFSLSHETLVPISLQRLTVVSTSEILGTLVKLTGCSDNNEATIIFVIAFFAPEALIAPCKWFPPVIFKCAHIL